MLAAVHQEADGIGEDGAARAEMPERFSAAGVERVEHAFARSAEYHAAASRHESGPGRRFQRKFPNQLARGMLQRADGTCGFHLRHAARVAAAEPLARRIRVLLFHEVRGLFAHGHIHKARQGAEARAEPVGCTVETRVDDSALGRGLRVRQPQRAAFDVQARRPGLSAELRAVEEFAGGAVQHVVKAVAVGDHHKLSIVGVHQHGHVSGIPIVEVVRRELKVPAQLAGVGIKRDQRAGVQIVAFACVAIVIGTGISGSPVDDVEGGIVCAGNPGRRAARLPTLALPGFVSSLAGAGHSPEAPQAAPGVRVVCIEKSANAELAARDPDQHFVAEGQRRRGNSVPGAIVGYHRVPAQLAGVKIDGQQVTVERAGEQQVFEHGQSAIGGAAAGVEVGRRAA